MSDDLLLQARVADDIEAAAYRDMFVAAPPEFVAGVGLRTEYFEGITLLMSRGIPDPVFCRAIGVGNLVSDAEEQIDQVIAAYREAGLEKYWIHVNPILAPKDIEAQLLQRGFVLAKRKSWAKMIRHVGTIPQIATTLTVREALSSERSATCTAIATAFGMPLPFAQWIQTLATRPRWSTVAAFDGSRIVGGGLLYMENNVGWLGLGSVLPEARGRNAHRAIMSLRIAIARDRQCEFVVTETGEPISDEPSPSLNNMYRCGFTRVCSRLNYASRPD